MQTTNHLISTDVSHLRNECTKGRIDLIVTLRSMKHWERLATYYFCPSPRVFLFRCHHFLGGGCARENSKLVESPFLRLLLDVPVPEVCSFSGGKIGEEVGLVGMLVQSQNHILREQWIRNKAWVDKYILVFK